MNSGAIEEVAEAIASGGYAIRPQFLDASVLGALRTECDSLQRDGLFRPAGIGTAKGLHVDARVRGDNICWIDTETAPAVVRHVLAELEALRVAVNRQMLLGLLEFEGHFARYEPGTGYERHYDQFRGTSRRQLTVTLYLNEDWRAAYGGNLRIHLDDADSPRAIDVMPAGGTLVSFLSARFAHEVLPATRQRLAMTGWFLRRD